MKNNRLKFISVIAAAALFTGCSGLNESSSSEKSETTIASSTTAENTTESAATSESSSESTTETAKVEIGSPEKTDINIGYLNSTAHLLAFVAAEEGYFKEEGLKVTLTQFSSASELINGIESDKLDVAFIGSVPTLTFQSQGHEVSIFGGAMTNGHGYVIKSEFADKDEAGVEVLKGRNVASVKNSVQDAELQILLKNANIEIGEGADKVNIVYFDSQKDAYAALLNSTIDAASVYSPYASLAKSQGYKVVYYCAHEKALENQPCCRQVAKTSALSGTPNTFIAIERAFIKAYHFTQSDHEKTIKDVKKYIDIDEDFIDTEVYGGYSVSSPDPDKKGTLTLKDTIVDLGYTNDYDIESHYNTDIYKKALDSILAEGSDDIYKSLEDHFNEFE
ncbi:ABC transporter substrate-binding protein [uncultured Ruminococcus sp.]|uniref:ABC transporter substrate-binding protein n=1 Tax=uncultured Ruminococcus sp. TaxID=165186 RepID=UPI0025EE1E52|nr:ABC transporter substrate-binding protein [uncultured Ruminococcus sp.]